MSSAYSPVETPGQDGQANTSRCIYPPRFCTALCVQCQLAAKKQILGFDRLDWSAQEDNEPRSVREQQDSDLDERDQSLIMPQSDSGDAVNRLNFHCANFCAPQV